MNIYLNETLKLVSDLNIERDMVHYKIKELMKKVERISIGGAPYMIDTDAHELLSSYLKSLSRKYGSNSENEMLLDIESRISEIINEKINSDSEVINIEMIRSVISQIGTVSSIEMDSMDTESGVRYQFDDSRGSGGISDVKKVAQDGIVVVQNVLSKTFKVIVSIVVMILMFAVSVIFIGSLIASYYIVELCVFPIILFVPMPLLAIMLILFIVSILQRTIDGGKNFISKKISILTLFILALVSLAGTIISGIELSSHNEYEQEVVEVRYVDIENITEIVVNVNEAGEPVHNWSLNNISHFKNEGHILIEQDIDIEEDSTLDRIKVVITKTSRGSSSSDAYRRAKELPVSFEVTDDTIFINKYLEVLGKDIMYDADVDIEITYPADKVIINRVFSDN